MSTWEIRTAGPIPIRAEAENETEAIEQAVTAGLLTDGETGSVYPADDLPVGWEGDDPEPI